MPALTRRRLLTLSDGSEEIAEMDGAGALLRRFIAGPGTDMPIAMATPNGSGGHVRLYVHANRQGSVVAMSNDAGSLAEGPYTYDPYGNGAPATGFPFKYTGRRLDPETGLYYYRARYYSSALGRFLQTDPIGYQDQMNLYAYVGNDPGNKNDPTGLACGDTPGDCYDPIFTPQIYRVHLSLAGSPDDRRKVADLYRAMAKNGGDPNAGWYNDYEISTRARVTMDPMKIKYSQTSVGREFSNGGDVLELAQDLATGKVKPGDILPIRVDTSKNLPIERGI